jgi:hypothetical protein
VNSNVEIIFVQELQCYEAKIDSFDKRKKKFQNAL